MDSLYSHIGVEMRKKEMICIVGAGGKTSVLFCLAGELSAEGKNILVTTTTAIYYPQKEQYDQIIISEEESVDLFDNISRIGVTVFGRSVTSEGKLLGATPEFLNAIYSKNTFDYIIIEGDGSKTRPIKAPAEYEPVIPSHTTKLLGIIGLDCIDKEVSREYVHRPDIFCSILGCKEGDIIDAETASRLITHEKGLFKGAPAFAEKYLILNKADGKKEMQDACDIAQKLLDSGYELEAIVISNMNNSSFRNAYEGDRI